MHEISPRRSDGQIVPADRPLARAASFETRVLTLPRDMTRGEARQLLADEAEYGKWELMRVIHYYGGTRKVHLRRRVMKVRRSDAA